MLTPPTHNVAAVFLIRKYGPLTPTQLDRAYVRHYPGVKLPVSPWLGILGQCAKLGLLVRVGRGRYAWRARKDKGYIA